MPKVKKQKSLKCDSCHKTKKDVQYCYDPFQEEVYNKKVKTKLCKQCYQSFCEDI